VQLILVDCPPPDQQLLPIQLRRQVHGMGLVLARTHPNLSISALNPVCLQESNAQKDPSQDYFQLNYCPGHRALFLPDLLSQ